MDYVDLLSSRNLFIRHYPEGGCDPLVFFTDETGEARIGCLARGTVKALLQSEVIFDTSGCGGIGFVDDCQMVREGRFDA